jgi:hypothetical protein
VPTIALLVVLPIGGAVFAAVNGALANRPPKLSRNGSVETRDLAASRRAPLTIARVLTSYSVTYRIERYDKTAVVVSTDVLDVRRPYDAHVAGSTPTTTTAAERVTRFGILGLATGTGARTLVNPPAPAGSDLRLEHVLTDAVKARALSIREQRKVLGRPCQVYRAGSTVAAGDLVALGAKPGEYSDFCVDRTGLLLEEVWFKDGRPLQRRIASRVRENPKLDDARFALPNEQAFPFDQGNGFMRDADPTSALAGPGWKLDNPPAGFTYRGRYAVQPPQLSPFARDPLTEPRPREQIAMVDVWERGPDILVLSQTIAADIAALPSTANNSIDVDLGAVGKGKAVLDLRSNDVRVELPQARFLRLYGTLARDDLVALARTLTPIQGTGIVFK